MDLLSKTPMKLNVAKRGTSFYLCHYLASWLGIDCRKQYDERHEEDIPPELNSLGPFSVTIFDKNQSPNTSFHDDFTLALLHGEKTSSGTRAMIQDRDQTTIVEIEV